MNSRERFIPPIIATLSSSFLIQSTAIWYNRGIRIKPPPALAAAAMRPSGTLNAIIDGF